MAVARQSRVQLFRSRQTGARHRHMFRNVPALQRRDASGLLGVGMCLQGPASGGYVGARSRRGPRHRDCVSFPCRAFGAGASGMDGSSPCDGPVHIRYGQNNVYFKRNSHFFQSFFVLVAFFVLPLQFRNSTLDPHIRSDIGHLR